MRPTFELFLLSLSSLFIELLAIRWLCSDFRAITVLSTFPLVACFVGLGVGFAIGHDRWFKFAPLPLLGMVLMIRAGDLFGLASYTYPTMATYQWGQLTQFGTAMWVYVFIFMIWLAVLLAFPFATMCLIGSRLGVLFNSMSPLRAYAIDISGAIIGSIIFTLFSFFCFPPAAQLLIPCLVLVIFNRRLLLAVIPVVVALVCAFVPIAADQGTIWTPYFRLQLKPVTYTDESGKQQTAGTLVKVNQMFQQYFFPDPEVRPTRPEDKPVADLMAARRNYYKVPYAICQPKDVLVLGAGTGSDVMQAVKHGATVDAVEIDPVVIKVGREMNPAYSSDKVNLICADARNYLHHCTKKYDLITVACLDSLAVTGMGSSVRIDSYVHTKESITRMLKLLKPDGLLVMSFGAGGSHWLRDRLYNTLRTAAGYEPIYLTDEHQKIFWPAFVYVAGPSVQAGTLKLPPIEGFDREPISVPENTRILTDDWPYLYVAPQVIDVPYLLLIAEIFLLSLFASRKLILRKPDFRNYQMLCLGAGFLLIELQAISRLSLLFGATWITSATVINGVLIMILAANYIVLKTGDQLRKYLALVYVVLFGTIALNYLLPINEMVNNASGGIGEPIFITALTLFPVMMAGIIFSTSFARVPVAGTALGFNLLGSVMGGLLELLSPYTGVRGLLLVALTIYALSSACWYVAEKEP